MPSSFFNANDLPSWSFFGFHDGHPLHMAEVALHVLCEVERRGGGWSRLGAGGNGIGKPVPS
jgi:hypothetical protein